MGENSALKDVQAFLDAKDGGPPRIRLPAVVAAINLGDATAIDELLTWLSGQRPLSKKDKEKAAKANKKSTAKPIVSDEFVQAAAMECVLLTDDKAVEKVTKVLQTIAATKDDKAWKGYVYATIALAQRGDAKAAAAMAALLESPKADIRNAVVLVLAAGGRDSQPGEYWMNAGTAAVADKGVLAALIKYYDAEANRDLKIKALHAIATTQAMLAR